MNHADLQLGQSRQTMQDLEKEKQRLFSDVKTTEAVWKKVQGNFL